MFERSSLLLMMSNRGPLSQNHNRVVRNEILVRPDILKKMPVYKPCSEVYQKGPITIYYRGANFLLVCRDVSSE